MSLPIEEAYEQVRTLIAMGRERGYLLSNEINDVLPAEDHSSEEIDDLLSSFERYGIDIFEDITAAMAARALREVAEPAEGEAVAKGEESSGAEESELDLTPGRLVKTDDPVRLYLREMGTVQLLKGHEEVAIAKRIERGRLVVLKTITRSPLIVKELIAIADDLRKGRRSVKEIVQFDEEELTEEVLEGKTLQTLEVLDKINALYTISLTQAVKLAGTPQSKRRLHLHARYARISNAHRDVAFGAFS